MDNNKIKYQKILETLKVLLLIIIIFIFKKIIIITGFFSIKV